MSYPINVRKPISDEFVKAVFNIKPTYFRELLNKRDFDKSLLNNICDEENHYFPIQWIPLCWEIILDNPESWKSDIVDLIRQKKQDNQEIKKIFREVLNAEFCPFELCGNEIWIYDWQAEETYEECFGYSKEEMLAMGQSEIDLDLYYAANKFNFEETEALLKKGGNPKCKVPGLGDCAIDMPDSRCADYSLELWHVIEKGETNPLLCSYRDLSYLLAWAINEKMYKLLSRYTNQ